MHVKLSLEEQAAPEDKQTVIDGLSQYNLQYSEAGHYQALNLFARDEQGRILGGLLGETFWRWLHIGILWVDAELRGQGIGDALLAHAESEAARRGCLHAQLETHEFQAPDFYAKRGYRVFGELEDFPPGHRKYFLVKDLGGNKQPSNA